MWLQHSNKILIQEGKTLLKSRTPFYYFCSEMLLVIKWHFCYERLEWWKKRAEFWRMNNVRNLLPVEGLAKLQIPLLFGAQTGSPLFCRFTEFYMEKGQPWQSDQLFHIICPKTLPVTVSHRRCSYSITVNCVTLPTHTALYLHGLKSILIQTDWTVMSVKFLVVLQIAKL